MRAVTLHSFFHAEQRSAIEVSLEVICLTILLEGLMQPERKLFSQTTLI
jgi:hypothetical protein